MEKLIDMIEELENPVVVASPAVLEEIVKALSLKGRLVKAGFRTFEGFARDLLGEYGVEARIALAREEGISPELAEIRLENSLLVSGGSQNPKLRDLFRIREKYKQHLRINPLREKFYENRPVLLVGAFFESDRFQRALLEIKGKTEVINYRFPVRKQKHRILEFENSKEEIAHLVQSVARLLSSGTDPERIKIQAVPESYLPYLKEAFWLADIDIETPESHSLFELEYVQDFLWELRKHFDREAGEGFAQALEVLKADESAKDLFGVLNPYLSGNFLVRDVFEDLVFQLKRAKAGRESFRNRILVADFRSRLLREGDILFVPAFNQDMFPETYLDEEYLTDSEREEIGLFTARDKNRAAREQALALLSGAAEVRLSCSRSHQGLRTPISGLVRHLDHEIVRPEPLAQTFAPRLDMVQLGKRLDLYYRYSETGEELFRLHATWPLLPYRAYSHGFTGVDGKDLGERLPRTLSYTSIDQYFRCGFLFYLEKVLRIKRKKNEEGLFVGTLFHFLLESLLEKEPDAPEEFLREELQEYLKRENVPLDAKTRFFTERYLEILSRFYRYLQGEKEISELKTVALEKEFQVPLPGGFVLEGKIDKIQTYRHAGVDHYVVVDYKSGNADIDLNMIVHGLNLQIPLYFYLLSKAGISVRFGGGYLQRVLPNSVFGRDKKYSYEEQIYRFFRKEGYSPDDPEKLKKIDINYGNSTSRLKGIRITKSGFHADSKRFLLSEADFEKILTIVEKKIAEAVAGISRGDFQINPKSCGQFDSCRYCAYKDLCFRDERDYVWLKENENLAFLREKNAAEET